MQTLEDFFRRNHIRMKAEETYSNPNMDADDWSRQASHWKCTIHFGKRRMTTYFSQGAAISRRPSPADVLNCLASDAAGVDNAGGFEDWAAEYGYDPDSRRAEKTYRLCERQTEKLKALLGPEAFKALVYNTERL